MRWIWIGMLWVAVALQHHVAGAQDVEQVLEPPKLLEEAAIPVPEALRAVSGSVTLRVLIDSEGSVQQAELIEGLHPELDALATSAALRSRFSPAKRGGQAMIARIAMRFDFPRPELAVPQPLAAAQSLPAALEPAPVPAVPQPSAAGAVVNILVEGKISDAQRLRESAEAVTVVSLADAQRSSADMGEVLARTAGFTLRRAGGLGTYVRFSLNGLHDDQIRVFLDGVPLEYAGFPFGFENVPVNLMRRLEIYRGVVPVRFGVDALGGALNLISEEDRRHNFANASYSIGSYGQHRLSGAGRYRDAATGVTLGLQAYYDVAENDYDVDVKVSDERGRLSDARVSRFHDSYRAYGAALEVGVTDRPWAKRLMLKVFTGRYDKELQHNLVMSVPYGDVEYSETIRGLTLRYEPPLSAKWDVELVANYGYRTVHFIDAGRWVYDWYGNRVRQRNQPGEVDSDPTNQIHWQHGLYGRWLVGYTPHPLHKLRVAVAPMFASRSGDERLQSNPNGRDPLSAKRRMWTLVLGAEYELNALQMPGAREANAYTPDRRQRLQNILMVKGYFYASDSSEIIPGGLLRARDVRADNVGVGEQLRVRLTPWALVKASYEFTLRFPRPDEVFGDGRLVQANLELRPELSHNVNFGPRIDLKDSPIGDLMLDASVFLRVADHLIVRLGNDRFFRHQNVYGARALGVQAEFEWWSPRKWVFLKGSTSYEDTRNNSAQGAFGAFDGDRIPNWPYLQASWEAKLHVASVFSQGDVIEPFYNARYVHEYFRGWEGQGIRESKQVVPSQLVHGVGIDYGISIDPAKLWFTLEIQNLLDARAYDLFGVQRPGRAFFAKIFGEFN